MIQRKLAWPLHKDDTHKSRNNSKFFEDLRAGPWRFQFLLQICPRASLLGPSAPHFFTISSSTDFWQFWPDNFAPLLLLEPEPMSWTSSSQLCPWIFTLTPFASNYRVPWLCIRCLLIMHVASTSTIMPWRIQVLVILFSFQKKWSFFSHSHIVAEKRLLCFRASCLIFVWGV